MLATVMAGLAALSLGEAVQATVLTFDVPSVSGTNAGYGDRVTSFGSLYGSAGGVTPNIVADFVTDDGSAFSIYSTGYASMQNALGHASFNKPGYLQLTPDAGFEVVLSGFQLAGWAGSVYPNSRIRVVDTAGTVYLDTGLFSFQPGVVLDFPGGDIHSALGLQIVVNDFGNLGLDNVVFSQVSSVPEVPPAAMLLAGLAGIAGIARLKRRLPQA